MTNTKYHAKCTGCSAHLATPAKVDHMRWVREHSVNEGHSVESWTSK